MAAQESRAMLLAGTALFGPLADADISVIAGHLRPVAFNAGQLIFSRGDAGRDLYVVQEGRVRLSILSSDGRELSLVHAAAGELFGEIAALDGGARSADATALGAVKALLLPQSALKSVLAANPRIASACIAFLCARIRDTNEKLEAIALHPIEVRLARFFLAAIKVRGGRPEPNVTLDLAMSQGELALLVGASRPKVNIALTVLEDSGAIARTGTTVICNVAALDALAATGV